MLGFMRCRGIEKGAVGCGVRIKMRDIHCCCISGGRFFLMIGVRGGEDDT